MFDNQKILDFFILGVAVVITITIFFLVNKPVSEDKEENHRLIKISKERSYESLPTMKNTKPTASHTRQLDDKNSVYRWVDDDGTVHYSDKPALNRNQALQIVSVDPNMNIIQPLKLNTIINTTKQHNLPETNQDTVLEQYERLCKTHVKGSLDYRHCRKAVHRKLKESCFDLRGQLNSVSSEKYQSLKKSEQRICSAYRKYAVVE